LNVFRMFSKMRGRLLPVASTSDAGVEAIRKSGVRTAPDVSALAALDHKALTALAWHYHDDDVAGPDAAVALTFSGLPHTGAATLTQYRVDDAHSNSFTAWKKMGSPAAPTPEQYKELEKAGLLQRLGPPEKVHVANGTLATRLTLPRQSVALLVLEWA